MPLQGDRFAFLITQGAALGYELLPLQGVWSLLAKVECKDTASERNESLLSNCRAQDIFCKDNKKLRIIVRNRVFFVLSSFSVKKIMLKNENKVSISSLNQIFAVPLQAESPWQNSQRLIFLIFLYIHF